MTRPRAVDGESQGPHEAQVRPVPVAPGWPILGNTIQLLTDPLGRLRRWYLSLGPAFRVSFMGRRAVFLAGSEVRELFTREGDDTLDRDFFYLTLHRELGGERLIFRSRGEEHAQLRKVTALSFSRQVAASRIPAAADSMLRCIESWRPGRRLDLLDAAAELALAGGWPVLFGDDAPGVTFADAARISRTIMRVSGRLRPGLACRLPTYRAAKRRCVAFLEQAIAERKLRPPEEEPEAPDALDCLLGTELEGGFRLSEREVAALGLLGFIGCTVYVNRVVAFMLRYALRDRELLSALRDEVDRAFALGLDHRRLRSMRMLYGVYLEALRLHPIWFAIPFRAARDFAFEGCPIRRGEVLAISPVQEHFSSDFYPQPERFDAFRCLPPREEHLQPGAFTPYGAGQRKCVALGLSEVLALLGAATLLHRAEGEIHPADRLRIRLDPLPGPYRVALRYRGPREPGLDARAAAVEGAEAPRELELAGLGPSDRELLLEQLAEVEDRSFAVGEDVVREGDPGDELFVVQSGEARVLRGFADGMEREVGELRPGDVFGELALLQRARRRRATVRVVGSVPLVAAVIPREVFLLLIRECNLVGAEILELVRRGRALRSLAMSFPALTSEERERLLPELETLRVEPGAAVIRQGEPADALYVVISGTFHVVREGAEGPERVASLGAGQCFGETGLLQAVPRTATVLADRAEAGELLRFPYSAFLSLLEVDAARRQLVALMYERAASQERSRDEERLD